MGDQKDSASDAGSTVKEKVEVNYDAIVVGSGISGGWAAKQLTEKRLKTLLIERCRYLKHIVDYPTTNYNPWELPHRGTVPLSVQEFKEDTVHFFLKDAQQEYIAEKLFDWIRANQVGGRSLLWARQTE